MKRQCLSLFLFLAMSPSAFAVQFPDKGRCITIHLNEAIDINNERKPLYSKLTNGASESITEDLIALEQKMLLGSFFLDRLAKKHQENGMPVFCQDMIPMEETPEFSTTYPDGAPNIKNYKKPNARVIKKDLKRALDRGGFQALDRAAMHWYNTLADQPKFNCLTRHFLESLVRSSRLAQKYDERARLTGVPSPDRLMKHYLRLSLIGIKPGIKLDATAAPLQARNIPILCQDVPFIPFDSDWMP